MVIELFPPALDSSSLFAANYSATQYIYMTEFEVVDIVVTQIDLPVRVSEVYGDFH